MINCLTTVLNHYNNYNNSVFETIMFYDLVSKRFFFFLPYSSLPFDFIPAAEEADEVNEQKT